MLRTVKDELLDNMDPTDPSAIRSRRDLRMINKFMGGERWIINELSQNTEIQHCIEIGAGEGLLSQKISQKMPHLKVSALDRIERPLKLAKEVEWLQEDVLKLSTQMDHSVAIVANLFIHHFTDDVLSKLFAKFNNVGVILLAEPYRSRGSLSLGRCLYPIVNSVTRHDMMVSIEAGFKPGELRKLLGNDWNCHEKKSLLGGIRLKALKTEHRKIEH